MRSLLETLYAYYQHENQLADTNHGIRCKYRRTVTSRSLGFWRTKPVSSGLSLRPPGRTACCEELVWVSAELETADGSRNATNRDSSYAACRINRYDASNSAASHSANLIDRYWVNYCADAVAFLSAEDQFSCFLAVVYVAIFSEHCTYITSTTTPLRRAYFGGSSSFTPLHFPFP